MQLRVRLIIPDPTLEDAGSVVRVTIVDTSLADALHPIVAETTTILEDGTGQVDVAVEVPDSALKEGHHYSLQAHVDRGGAGEIKPGDLIITENVPVSARDDRGSWHLSAKLTRI